MECPICYEQITNTTGQVTTSCGHSFHFKCLNTWYYQQLQQEDGVETCPCCRKEPGDFERCSVVEDGTDMDAESESLSESSVPGAHADHTEWVRVGPRRWIIPSSTEHRLQILAQISSEQQKENELRIPPYNGEAHALWVLRNLFDAPLEPAGPWEQIHPVDRPKMLRRRRRSFGRDFWTHLGTDHRLKEIDGYKSD